MRTEYGALKDLSPEVIAELFHNGMSVVMLIDRQFGNSHKGSRRWINKLISFDKGSFEVNVEKLIKQQDYLNLPSIRLYASLNYRDLDKAVRRFFHMYLDVTKFDTPRFWACINANFVSAMMKPESRVSSPKRWLLDIDSLESFDFIAAEQFLGEQGVWFKHTYKTPGGWHAIVEPFNKQKVVLPEWVENKQDGLVLLRAFDESNADI